MNRYITSLLPRIATATQSSCRFVQDSSAANMQFLSKWDFFALNLYFVKRIELDRILLRNMVV